MSFTDSNLLCSIPLDCSRAATLAALIKCGGFFLNLLKVMRPSFFFLFFYNSL